MREQNLWTRKTFFKYVYWTLGGLFVLSCLAGRQVVGHEMFIITLIIISQAIRIALRYIEIKRRKSRLEEPIRVNLPRTADGQYVYPQHQAYLNGYPAHNEQERHPNEQFDGRSSISSGNSDGDDWKSIRPTSCCSKWLSNILIVVEVIIVIYCAIAVICLFCGMIASIGRDNHSKYREDEVRTNKKGEGHRLLQGIAEGESHPRDHREESHDHPHSPPANPTSPDAGRNHKEGDKSREKEQEPKPHGQPEPETPSARKDHGEEKDRRDQQEVEAKKDSKHHDHDDEDDFRAEDRERMPGHYQPGFFYYLLCMLFHAVGLIRSLFNLKAFSKSSGSDDEEIGDYRDPSNYYMHDQGYQLPVYAAEPGYNPHTGYAPRAPPAQPRENRDPEGHQQQPKRINLLDWRSPQVNQAPNQKQELQLNSNESIVTPVPTHQFGQEAPQQPMRQDPGFVGLSRNPPVLTAAPGSSKQQTPVNPQRPVWDNRPAGLLTTDAKTAQMFVPKVKTCLICGHFLSREDQVKYLPNCGHIMHFACFARDVSAPVDQCPVCVYQRTTAGPTTNNTTSMQVPEI